MESSGSDPLEIVIVSLEEKMHFRIYNDIAKLCSLVIRSCEADSLFLKFSCVSDRAKSCIQEKIREKVGMLFEPFPARLCIRQLQETDLDEDFFQELEKFIQELDEKGDRFSMIGLAQVLDESLHEQLQMQVRSFQADRFTVVLNTNRESVGIGVLPRCSCVWERKHRLSHSYNQLDNFLVNLFLLENTVLNDMIDKHFFLPDEFFPVFSATKKLNIAASPLRIERRFSTERFERENVQYFRIYYDNCDFTEDNECVWNKILEASKAECDIIVFPELLGNPQMETYIRSKIDALDDDEKRSLPAMIILPSLWEKCFNTVTVLDRTGKVVCRQSKQNPFRLEGAGNGYLEDIIANQVINIFHYEGIGRFAILICKDFLTTKYMEQLMRCFKLTLIIVPSFSSGSYDFRQSFDLCAHDDCNVVWINTCASMTSGKEDNFENIGYVRKRIGRNDDDSQKLCCMPICEGAFCGVCKHDCIFYESIPGV